MKDLKNFILEAKIKADKLEYGTMFILKKDWSFELRNIEFTESHRYIPTGSVSSLKKMAKRKNSLITLENDMGDKYVRFAEGSEFMFKTINNDFIILDYVYKGENCFSIALEDYDFDNKFFKKHGK